MRMGLIMKKQKIEFLTFNDGIVNIFETDEDDEIIKDTRKIYRFGNRTIGVKRYYSARENDIELKKVIHIHFKSDMTTDKAVVINNTRYKIEQVQFLYDTNPRCTVLSLSQRGLYEGEEYDL